MINLDEINWTDEQQEFLNLDKNGKFVVKACPGSGKTTAVVGRLYNFIKNWDKKKSGIAVLSFTNVAADEIIDTFENQEHNLKIGYPHFVGTLDSFINNYIFLPYGKLVMGCDEKPTLVGEPFNYWVYDEYPEKYFVKITYATDGKLIYPENLPHMDKIDNMKYNLSNEGFATQKDAIYHAKCVLEQYPHIAKFLSLRFPHIIIDEAQDTTKMHMEIIDLLIENGLENIILVGDPEQALYEWNNAKPSLFTKKYLEWEENSIIFKTNFRSSQKICDFFSKLSKIPSIESKCQHQFDLSPIICPTHTKNYDNLINKFLRYCASQDVEITKENVAVLFRGSYEVNKLKRTFNKRYIFNIFKDHDLFKKSFTSNILEGLYLWNNGECLEGFKKIEREYLKFKKDISHVNNLDIAEEIRHIGFQKHRLNVYNFIKQFPKIKDNQNMASLINEFNNQNHDLKLCQINYDYSDLTFELLFNGALKNDELNFNVGTVHSVKGESFDAVLLILKNKANKDDFYRELINSDCYLCEEELRIVYVALSRPKKILQIVVPKNDYYLWNSIFY